MRTNMLSIDRVLRLVAGVLLVILYLSGIIPSDIGLILQIVAVTFIVTSFTGYCPLYALLGIRAKSQ